MIDKKEIGKRIILVRKYLKLNQVVFSKEIEVTQQTISQIETGIIAPSLEIIYKITGNYSISYEWLITGEGSMLKTTIIGDMNQTYNGNVHNMMNIKGVEIQKNNTKTESEMIIEILKRENNILKDQIEELKKDKEKLFAIINRS